MDKNIIELKARSAVVKIDVIKVKSNVEILRWV